jgi:putative ABC transport system permease protein
VDSASIAATIPFGIINLGKSVRRSGDAASAAAGSASNANEVDCRYNVVSAGYFQTMEIPLLRGRAFDASDSTNGETKTAATGAARPAAAGTNSATHSVAILDQSAAEKLFPGGEAVGKNVRMGSEGGNEPPLDVEVVGVVSNIQESISGPRWLPHIYVPFGQAYLSDTNIHLRTAAQDPQSEAQLLETVRSEIRATDPHLPVLSLKTMRMHMESSIDLWIVRMGANMFMIFGGVALLLAAIGLYGVRAYTVAMRTREIGIRMALGARSSDLVRMVVGNGLRLAVAGIAAGVLGALAFTRIVAGLLYGVKPTDLATFVAAAFVLLAAVLLAALIPARAAAKVDPMVALRQE